VVRLGEVLVERGLLSPDALRAGLDACRRHGGRLGTWLVRLGFINEAALLDVLSQQTGCPTATAVELTTAPLELRTILPPSLARRHLLVPFYRQGRILSVAMVNPNDLVVIDEISRITGCTIQPHVATEAALAAALALPAKPAPGMAGAPSPGPPAAAKREWRQFWQLESAPTEIMKGLEAPALPIVDHAAATFPLLAPLGDGSAVMPAAPAEDLAESMSMATHRDQVASLVLGALAREGLRVALFSIHQGRVMAWAGAGLGLVTEDFQTLMLPLDRPSIFLNVSQGAEFHVGPLIGGEGNEVLYTAMGNPPPAEAIVVPLRVRGKLAGFLWVDKGEKSVAEIAVAEVREVARLTSLTLEILVLRQKIKLSPLDRKTGED
jgi:Type II secretion system (T2SS), protein E, N-terminal domain